jgi:hypothetical protein
MEALLLKVYEEFYHFYVYKQRKPHNWGRKLTIQKEETITRPKVVESEDQDSLATDNGLN